MKLYFSPGACSLAPHIVLQEAGARFATEKVDLKSHTVGSTDYYQINKKGSVPALELDNGERLTEAAIVSQYIADQNPNAKLIPPPGTWDRYRLQEWMNYIATELHKGFGPLFNPAFPEEARKISLVNLDKKFSFLNDHLAKQNYMMGEAFSVADAYLFVMVLWAAKHKLDLSKYAAVTAFGERMKSRPNVQMVLKNEGLI